MNKKTFNCTFWLQEAITYEGAAKLNPYDFLNCEDEDELRDEIYEELFEKMEETYRERLDHELHIPNKFLEIWKNLKEGINIQNL